MKHCFVIIATDTRTGKSIERMDQYETKDEAKAIVNSLNSPDGKFHYRVKAKSIKG